MPWLTIATCNIKRQVLDEFPQVDISLLQESKVANSEVTAVAQWLRGAAKRRGVSIVWGGRKELVGKVDVATTHAVVVYNWYGAGGLICSVYLPTHGASAEFQNSLEASESLLLSAPQVGWICVAVGFNTVGGSWLTDSDIFGPGWYEEMEPNAWAAALRAWVARCNFREVTAKTSARVPSQARHGRRGQRDSHLG